MLPLWSRVLRFDCIKKEGFTECKTLSFAPCCDSAGIQTRNLLIRSQMLYSVELRSHISLSECKGSAKNRNCQTIPAFFFTKSGKFLQRASYYRIFPLFLCENVVLGSLSFLLLFHFDEQQTDADPRQFPEPDDERHEDARRRWQAERSRRHEESALATTKLQRYENSRLAKSDVKARMRMQSR